MMHPKTLENVDNYSPKALGSQNLHQAAAYENRTKRAASPQNTVTLKDQQQSKKDTDTCRAGKLRTPAFPYALASSAAGKKYEPEGP